MRSRARTPMALVVAALALAPTHAWTDEPPPARECARVLLTCVGYVAPDEPETRARFRDGVKILALHDGELSSRTLCNDLVAGVREWGATRRVGGKYRVGKVAAELYSSAEDLARLLEEHDYDLIFVSEGLHGYVEEIAKVARAEKVLTTCVSKANVEDGLALGFAIEERRLAIYLNRAAAAACGFQFRSALVRRATLLGEEEEG